MTKEDLINQLKCSEVSIKFTKKDGTERTLLGTLDPIKLPARSSTDVKEHKEPTTDAVAVYDLENQGWRSFNFSNLISINGESVCG